MSEWSYSGDPLASERDAVRFMIGDTDACDKQLSNNEIDYLLQVEGSVTQAAIVAAENLAAKYARLVDEQVGAVRISYSQRSRRYSDIANTLKARRNTAGAAPYVGGISKSDKQIDENDSDLVRPAFTRDLHENEETSALADDCEC